MVNVERIHDALALSVGGDLDALDDLATALVAKRCSQPLLLPNGETLRCRSRLIDNCRSCAAQTLGDWLAIARSGVVDPPGDFAWYFLTLTAPSFGPCHSSARTKDGTPVPCRCGVIHADELAGTPLEPETYDYHGAVMFNLGVGRLWNNTKARLRGSWPSIEWFSSRERQRRQTLHLHTALRVSAHEAPSPEELRHRALSTTAKHPVDGSPLVWGPQSTCDAIVDLADGARALRYSLKNVLGYSVKSIGTRHGSDASPEMLAHFERLNNVAAAINCGKPGCEAGRCETAYHDNQGCRGQLVTYSRTTTKRPGWSFTGLTRRAQRETRKEWAERVYANASNGFEDYQLMAWATEHLAGRA